MPDIPHTAHAARLGFTPSEPQRGHIRQQSPFAFILKRARDIETTAPHEQRRGESQSRDAPAAVAAGALPRAASASSAPGPSSRDAPAAVAVGASQRTEPSSQAPVRPQPGAVFRHRFAVATSTARSRCGVLFTPWRVRIYGVIYANRRPRAGAHSTLRRHGDGALHTHHEASSLWAALIDRRLLWDVRAG